MQKTNIDLGEHPTVLNINQATLNNKNYRTTFWTGKHLQLTFMSIPVGSDIGLEAHPTTDQFLRIEQGRGLVLMGTNKDNLYFRHHVENDDAIFVPAGTWHNVVNIGNKELKLYSIYAPPNHKKGAVHPTKAIAELEEED